jgi:RNA polymerase sigma-70 factor (ECF subfamily)
LFSWLCSIAINALIDEIRAAKGRAEKEQDSNTEDDPAQVVERQDQTVRIHEILHTMEEPYKEVFSLRVFGELPFSLIGRLFGKSDNWARVTYYRAKLKLRERMEAYED